MNDSPSTAPINRVPDLSVATDFELKHVPMLSAEAVDGGIKLKIEMGRVVVHPSTPDHWFNWIDVRVAGASIARIDLSHVTAPRVAFTLALEPGTVVEVLASCNLHGVWQTDITL